MSNTNSKHTPLPWVINSQKNLVISGKKWIADTTGANGFDKINQDEVVANTELIVKAVNSHEELVEVVDWIAQFVLTAKDGGDAWCSVRNQKGASEWAKKMRAVTEKLGLKYV